MSRIAQQAAAFCQRILTQRNANTVEYFSFGFANIFKGKLIAFECRKNDQFEYSTCIPKRGRT